MKKIRVEDAVGHILPHDLTQIIKDVKKGPRFKKGHIVREEDIPVLLSMGKEHLYIMEIAEDEYHENDAAEILAEILSGLNLKKSEVSEGKINIISTKDGILKIDKDLLCKLNSIENIIIATTLNNKVIKKDEIVAGTRVVPLLIKKDIMKKVQEISGNKKILNLLEFKQLNVAIITTGSEVYNGRIEDKFTDVVREKISNYEMKEIYHRYCDDSIEMINEALEESYEKGADLILCCGGMSVDPDDNTPGAIFKFADNVVSYGFPVLPGSMTMLAYKEDKPIIGLPGSVMFAKKTAFDLILPRIATGDVLTREDIVVLGHGGLI